MSKDLSSLRDRVARSMGSVPLERDLLALAESLSSERDRLLKLNAALAEKLDQVCAQRDTAIGYGSDAGEPPWMK